MQDQVHRPTYGASVSPTGTDFAHIVKIKGYPHAVQRYLDGLSVTDSRVIKLPVEGPVTKVLHSDDGHWLACEVNPQGSELSQVWIVTTDPSDPTAIRVDDSDDTAAHLIAWDGDTLATSILGDNGVGESRLVDPRTLDFEVVDSSRLGKLSDVLDGATQWQMAWELVRDRGDIATELSVPALVDKLMKLSEEIDSNLASVDDVREQTEAFIHNILQSPKHCQAMTCPSRRRSCSLPARPWPLFTMTLL